MYWKCGYMMFQFWFFYSTDLWTHNSKSISKRKETPREPTSEDLTLAIAIWIEVLTHGGTGSKMAEMFFTVNLPKGQFFSTKRHCNTRLSTKLSWHSRGFEKILIIPYLKLVLSWEKSKGFWGKTMTLSRPTYIYKKKTQVKKQRVWRLNGGCWRPFWLEFQS